TIQRASNLASWLSKYSPSQLYSQAALLEQRLIVLTGRFKTRGLISGCSFTAFFFNKATILWAPF
ncbi:MAG: hypothetical protein KAG86_08555, partial [Gammaproteobacteria bacterium]|nr:hypothetical protein [Gammaproteobacteria bacterium]